MAVAVSRDWEQTLRAWSGPSSPTEAEKCERAERMVKQAINGYWWFRDVQVSVYAKGSYANNTNVRLESDVDIAVELKRSFLVDASEVPSFSAARAGIITSAQDTFGEFKSHVYRALVGKFGTAAVNPGNKAFDVHENTSRVDADVVPCWEYRKYYGSGPTDYRHGTELIADDGEVIINWPQLQTLFGNQKNLRTNYRYKFITRAVKRLRNEMAASGAAVAQPIPSYLIECLIWNVPNVLFNDPRYVEVVKNVLVYIAVNASENWMEVNLMKPLFGPGQCWTVAQARSFAHAAFYALI